MTDLFSDFTKHTLEDWKQAVLKELKTRDSESLRSYDDLEGLTIYPYSAIEDLTKIESFVKAIDRAQPSNMTWKNMTCIDLSSNYSANSLDELKQNGVDTVCFINNPKNPFKNWKSLFTLLSKSQAEIQIELLSLSDFRDVLSENPSILYKLNIDPLLIDSREKQEFFMLANETAIPCFRINAFAIQQCGASATQELAFALSTAHQTLVDLMTSGMSFERAYQSIHFHFGAGSDFFLQSVKLRVFRLLWKRVASSYSAGKPVPETTISVLTGHLNKSLADPYTNLLRQTTEVLSSINGLANYICVLPYDSESSDGQTELADRMARNLPLIMKHESFLNPIHDPLSGSYSMERLSFDFAENSWNYFQKIENEGTLFNENCQRVFLKEVALLAQKRISSITANEQVLIGVNKYPNPQNISANWKQAKNYLGLPYLRIESSLKNETV